MWRGGRATDRHHPGTTSPDISLPPTEDDLAGGEDTGDISQGEPVCENVSLEITSGPTAGDEAQIQVTPSEGSPQLQGGRSHRGGLRLRRPPGFRYRDYQRTGRLLVLGALFVASVLLLGWFRGLRALLGAAVSLVVLATFLLPALLSGESPCSSLSSPRRLSRWPPSTWPTASTTGARSLTWGRPPPSCSPGSWRRCSWRLATSPAWPTRRRPSADQRAGSTSAASCGQDRDRHEGVLDDVTVTQVSAVWARETRIPTCRAGGCTDRRCESDGTTSPRPSTRWCWPTPGPRSGFCPVQPGRPARQRRPERRGGGCRIVARWWAASAWWPPFPSRPAWPSWP